MFRIKLVPLTNEPEKYGREFIGNPLDKYSDMFDKFTGMYDLKQMISCDEWHKRTLKPKTERTCRFCKAVFSKDEKFKSKAHLIPELLGNDYIFSDFECDRCNALFSKYENDLANFIGVARAMSRRNANAGRIKFKSPDKTFIVMKDAETPEIPKLRIESHEEENDHFTLNPDSKTVTFQTVRDAYNPHNVYRALLKIGLSLLPDASMKDYGIALSMLRGDRKNEEADNPMFKLNCYVHPGPAFPCPMALLFEKKDKTQPVPMHMVCLMFLNHTYQLALPLCKEDKWMYDGKTTITIPNMPPFIDNHFANDFGLPKEHRLNFNLDEIKKGEKHQITYSFDSFSDTRFA